VLCGWSWKASVRGCIPLTRVWRVRAALCLTGIGIAVRRGKGAMGMGDVKLSALLGLICGYRRKAVPLHAMRFVRDAGGLSAGLAGGWWVEKTPVGVGGVQSPLKTQRSQVPVVNLAVVADLFDHLIEGIGRGPFWSAVRRLWRRTGGSFLRPRSSCHQCWRR